MSDTNRQEPDPRLRANTVPWPPILIAAAVIGAWLLGRVAPLAWPGLDDAASHVIGWGFGLIGVALIFWSVRTLNEAGTTFRPDRGSSALVTHGPYSRFRNPIYLGDVLVMLGLADLTQNVWFVVAALAFAVLVTVLQILPEERHLEARFGDAYRQYRARSRRWI